jgi:hypothetical protein
MQENDTRPHWAAMTLFPILSVIGAVWFLTTWEEPEHPRRLTTSSYVPPPAQPSQPIGPHYSTESVKPLKPYEKVNLIGDDYRAADNRARVAISIACKRMRYYRAADDRARKAIEDARSQSLRAELGIPQ